MVSKQDIVPAPSPARLHLTLVLRTAMLLVALAVSGSIALFSEFANHPDEFMHIDVFVYHQSHWWPPDLGSDEVLYTVHGWSRAFSQEIVYILYGRLGGGVIALLDAAGIEPGAAAPYYIYRLGNALLLVLTAGTLFSVRSRTVSLTAIGSALLCIPQVYYLYGYANSDAWATSLGILVFVVGLRLADTVPGRWSWGQTILLGALTGLLLTSKKPYQLALVLPYALLVQRLSASRSVGLHSLLRMIGGKLLVAGLLAVLVAAPLQWIYPATQGDYEAAMRHMREEKAEEGWKPNNPSAPLYHLGSKGENALDILVHRPWIKVSLKSFYGLFGKMTIHGPPWLYVSAYSLALVCFFLTIFTAIRCWGQMPIALRFLLVLAPIVTMLNVAASVYNSLRVDFQPQGRYLFPSLVPIVILLTGALGFEPRRTRSFRIGVFLVLYALCLYTLVFVLGASPLFEWTRSP